MNKKIFFLFLLPLFLLVLACIFRMERAYVYTTMVDPDYAYLFNGLNLAQPSLILGHIDHPGTPLQVLCTVTTRITNFFVGNLPLNEDVFRNPELYINTIIFVILIINAILLFFLGRVVYVTTGSILKAMFMQLTPFISHHIISVVSLRLMTEPLLIATTLFLLIFIFKYLRLDNEQTEKKSFLYIVIFAAIIGFGTGVKITFFPFLFIPLLLFNGLKKKFFYVICIIISFLIFVFPVIKYWEKFSYWIENLVIHSERYGTGKADFINTNSFIYNLKTIRDSDILHTIIFVGIIITILFYFIPKLKLKKVNDKNFKLLAGVFITIILEIFLVAKHYSPHYLIPAMALLIFSAFLIYEIILSAGIPFKKTISVIVFLSFIILLPAQRYVQVMSELPYFKKCVTDRMKTIQFIDDNLRSNACVVVPADYTCSFKEFGNFFGLAWCGDYYAEYARILKSIYPNIYFYMPWDDSFKFWSDKFQAIDILKKHKKLNLYIADNNIVKEDKFINMFKKDDLSGRLLFTKIFENKPTNEVIFLLEYKSTYAENDVISDSFCDMESLSKDNKYFTGTNKSLFENGISQSKDYALSGNFSSAMPLEYGGVSYIFPKVKSGEKYLVSIWRKKENQNCYIVVTGEASDGFYEACNTSYNEKYGWEELSLEFVIPQKMNNKKLTAYTWNPSKGKTAYFDDFRICKLK